MTVTFDDGRIQLDVKPSAIMDTRELHQFFKILNDYLNSIGVETDSFSASIVVDYLDDRK